MYDDSKPVSASNGRRRIPRPGPHRVLVVANPNEEGAGRGPRQPTYVPPPLPNPLTQGDEDHKHSAPHPGPISTDNLRQKYHPHSNTSDLTLSSPSTPTSSPAVESTPPPSTPGQKSGPSIDYAQGSDRSDGSQPLIPGRPEKFVRQIANPFNHAHRKSSIHDAAIVSPIHQEQYPPTRSNSMNNKVQILVTAESDDYKIVDITNARDAAYIRERIFSKLRISDDDQAHFSIYRTEIGCFAISEALTDDQLFSLCQTHGDSKGTLKFLVSYTSATVHEPPLDLSLSQTVHTIPPPVLPHSNVIYSPVSGRQRSPSPQRSLSSASERILQESGTGYDASGSDDVDNIERNSNRATIRPVPNKTNSLSFQPPAILIPHTPTDKLRAPPEVAPLRLEKNNPQSASSQQMSPNTARFPYVEENQGTSLWRSPITSTTDVPSEWERIVGQSENKVEMADNQRRLLQEKEEKEKQRRRDGQRRAHDSQRPRGGGEHWTVVPSDIPHSDYKNERPSAGNDSPRCPFTRRPQGYSEHPSYGARNQSGERKSRRQVGHGQQVPFHWAVAWRADGGKPDPKLSPTTTPSLYRGIKSMENLRASSAKLPASLQPGGQTRPPLPTAKPTPSGTFGNQESDFNLPHSQKFYDGRNNIMSPTAVLARPLPIAGLPSSSSNLGPTSSSDPFVRPRSAMGESASSAYSNKPWPIPSQANRTEGDSVLNGAIGRSPPSAPSNQYGYPSTSRSPYGYDGSSNVLPKIVHSSQSAHERPIDPPLERGALPHMTNPTPPSPVSPSSPRYSASSEPSPAINSPHENSAEATLKGVRYPWLPPALDGQSMDNTLMPRREQPNIKPLPPHPGLRHPQGHPHSPPPPLPIPPFPSPSADGSSYLSTHSTPTVTNSGTTSISSSTSFTTLLSASSPIFSAYNASPKEPVDDGSDSGSNESGTLWAVGNDLRGRLQLSPEKRRSMRGPLLTLQTEKVSQVSPPQSTSTPKQGPLLPRLPDCSPPEYHPYPLRRSKHRTATGSGSGHSKQGNRTSVFNEAFRPQPEEVYERLGDFFPEHDLDEPVIEASSGGTSPTSVDNPATPALSQALDKRKHKKSIRVVANEHKRRLDRTSHATSANMANNVLRKRSTKLWGSKLEEVTAEQVRDGLFGSIPESPGPKPIFKWVRGELIGRGTYGKVYVALNATTGEMIAVKQVEIPTTESDRNDTRQITVVEALKSESETLKDLDHPNVVQYLGFEETPKYLSVFLEYVPGGSVASCLKRLGRFNENVTKSFTGQILDGLNYLHSKGVLHRDLKADNILVERFGLCKISDFGISKRTDDINGIGAYTSMQGSVFWMAPEVVDSQKKGYNSKIDIWSVGCVVFEMWTGQRPWIGKEAFAVLLQLYQTKGGPPVPQNVELSSLADNFRNQCFAMNPDERPSASELRLHPYLELPPGWEFTDFV